MVFVELWLWHRWARIEFHLPHLLVQGVIVVEEPSVVSICCGCSNHVNVGFTILVHLEHSGVEGIMQIMELLPVSGIVLAAVPVESLINLLHDCAILLVSIRHVLEDRSWRRLHREGIDDGLVVVGKQYFLYDF